MTALLIGLIIASLIRELMFFIERRDMLDRLMSRNLDDYKANAQIEPNQLDDTSPLEALEAHQEEILNG